MINTEGHPLSKKDDPRMQALGVWQVVQRAYEIDKVGSLILAVLSARTWMAPNFLRWLFDIYGRKDDMPPMANMCNLLLERRRRS